MRARHVADRKGSAMNDNMRDADRVTADHNRIGQKLFRDFMNETTVKGMPASEALVIAESFIVGVMLVNVKLGGDKVVVDMMIERTRARLLEALADARLSSIKTEGQA
jgi:hypothetical protein